MRDAVVQAFNSALAPHIPSIERICVVGGSQADPELRIFTERAASITILGVEASQVFFDLNDPTSNCESSFDLVLCSQVLEHVWRPELALHLLATLVRPGGYIWVACPFSNFPHGSPDFYSAGYTNALIEKNLELNGLQVLSSGSVSSKRNYLARHRFRLWLSVAETAAPQRYLLTRSILESANRLRKYGKQLFTLALIPESRHETWSVESYVFARKPEIT